VALEGRWEVMKKVALSEVKDDLSRF